MADPPFPVWFYYGMLTAMGWPRKVGLRRRLVVDSMIADHLTKQLGDIGRIIGAADYRLASGLLADCFPTRNWNEPMQDVVDLLERQHEAGPMNLLELGQETPWESLKDPRMTTETVASFAGELWFGLTHPGEVKAAFDESLRGSRENAARWSKAGLAVDSTKIATSADEWTAQAVSGVREYEADCGQVGPVPPQLASLMAQFLQT